MSAIILSNPFIPPSPPVAAPGADLPSPAVVAPVSAAAPGSGADDARPRTGGGQDGSGQDTALLQLRIGQGGRGGQSTQRPQDASRSSVVAAQVSSALNTDHPPSADDPMALPKDFPFNKKLPEVKMPDPLPTSPILKQA